MLYFTSKNQFCENIRATWTNGPSPEWDNIQEKLQDKLVALSFVKAHF